VFESIFYKPTEPIEIFNVINSLNMNKSNGADDISPYFVKLAAPDISEPLSILANYMFSVGIFPDALKIA